MRCCWCWWCWWLAFSLFLSGDEDDTLGRALGTRFTAYATDLPMIRRQKKTCVRVTIDRSSLTPALSLYSIDRSVSDGTVTNNNHTKHTKRTHCPQGGP
uniref:Putative secreted protein n=1 Tax=Anopheles marajoara TaxID=58244 RepID=A0A2M4C970_9DIPT